MQTSPDVLSKLGSDIDRDAGKVQDFFVRILKVNTVNPRMGGPGKMDRANFTQSLLEGEGFEVSRVDAPDSGYKRRIRPNICTKLEGTDRRRTLWFIAHMGTVPKGSAELWNSDPFEPRVDDGKIFARGAEDNGQSLVSSLCPQSGFGPSESSLGKGGFRPWYGAPWTIYRKSPTSTNELRI